MPSSQSKSAMSQKAIPTTQGSPGSSVQENAPRPRVREVRRSSRPVGSASSILQSEGFEAPDPAARREEGGSALRPSSPELTTGSGRQSITRREGSLQSGGASRADRRTCRQVVVRGFRSGLSGGGRCRGRGRRRGRRAMLRLRSAPRRFDSPRFESGRQFHTTPLHARAFWRRLNALVQAQTDQWATTAKPRIALGDGQPAGPSGAAAVRIGFVSQQAITRAKTLAK